ncbi:MAG: hypothetical protein APR63_07935 [Desulfuromonas sp. SDB]|nr:MAG: hypothetical protein APR63_07935 [Desulfuromonas sp. SDB]
MSFIRFNATSFLETRFNLIWLGIIISCLLYSCGANQNLVIVQEEAPYTSELIDIAVSNLLNLGSFSSQWEIVRNDIEPYQDLSVKYDLFYNFPDKLKLIGRSYDAQQQIIANGSSEFHRVGNHWEEYPRSELSDLDFQLELIFLKQQFRFVGLTDDNMIVFAFQPNIPLLDPLSVIQTTGFVTIRQQDSLLSEISVYSPDSSLFWNFKVLDYSSSEKIISPRAVQYQYSLNFTDISDTAIIRKRMEKLGMDNVEFSSSGRNINLSFLSAVDPADFLSFVTCTGSFSFDLGAWPDTSPQLLIDNPEIMDSIYGVNSTMDTIGDIPYRLVISLNDRIYIDKSDIDEVLVNTDPAGRIGLKLGLSSEMSERLNTKFSSNPGKLLLLYMDDNLLAAVPIYSYQIDDVFFLWEKDNKFPVDVIRSILSNPKLSGEVYRAF